MYRIQTNSTMPISRKIQLMKEKIYQLVETDPEMRHEIIKQTY